MKPFFGYLCLIITLLGFTSAECAPGPVPVPRWGSRLMNGQAAVSPALPAQQPQLSIAPPASGSALGVRPHRPSYRPATALPRRLPHRLGLGMAMRALRRALATPTGGVAQDGKVNIFALISIIAGGLSIGLLVLGFLISYGFVASLPLAILAVVMGIIGIKKTQGLDEILSIIGLILGAGTILLFLLMLVLLIAFFALIF